MGKGGGHVTTKETPELKPLLMMDVDDIYLHAKQLKIPLSKKEAIEIFNGIDRGDWDCENSTFWAFIENAIREYRRSG